VEASTDIELKIEALDPNSSVYTPVVKGSVKPKFDVSMTAEGGVNAWLVKPSLEATVTLVKIEMPAVASLRPKLEEPAAPTTYAVMSFVSQPSTTTTFTSLSTGTFTSTSTQSTSTSTNTQPAPTNEGRTFIAAWDVDLNLSALNGKIDAVVEYYKFWNPFDLGWKTYRGTIYTWDGISTSISLTSGEKEITLGGGPMVATQ